MNTPTHRWSRLAGLAFVVLFAFHGANYLTLRTTGDLYERVRLAARRLAMPAAVVGAAFLVWTVVVAVDRNEKDVLPVVIPAILGVAAALILNAFQSNLVFFYTPSQVVAKEAPQARSFRVGGLVEQGSVQRQADGVTVRFVVTDTANSLPVLYTGILPDLFKEGKGVVAQGQIGADGVFRAKEVLAKHDENYMPPQAADAVQRARKAMQESQKTLQEKK